MNDKGDIIEKNFSFTNVFIKKEHDKEREHCFFCFDINVSSMMDLAYLRDNDYALCFKDKGQERIFCAYGTNFIIDKKPEAFRIFGTSALIDYKLSYRLSCFILSSYGKLDMSLYQDYKEAVEKGE